MSGILLAATLTGGIATALVLLLKPRLLRHLGGRGYYAAMMAAMLLFLLPVRIPVTHTLAPEPVQQNRDWPDPAVVQMGEYENAAPPAVTDPAEPAEPSTDAPAPDLPAGAFVITAGHVIWAVWLTGAALTLVRYYMGYFRFKRQVLDGQVVFRYHNLPVVRSRHVCSPMLIGFLRPSIVLPELAVGEKTLSLALYHEYCHYKAKDTWIKLGAVLVHAVHWFNPVSYALLKGIGEACEYACDERVTLDMDPEERRAYGKAILSYVSASTPALSSSFAKQQKGMLRRRIIQMMQKDRRRRGLGAVLLGVVLAGSLLVTAVAFADTVTLLADRDMPIDETNGGYHTNYIPLQEDGFTGTMQDNILRQLYSYEDYIALSPTGTSIWIENATEVNAYVGFSGRHIAIGNKEEVARGVLLGWCARNEETAHLIQKEWEICGRTVYVGFGEEAMAFVEDPVMERMVRTQIQYELEGYEAQWPWPTEWDQSYDHAAFVDALIDQGIYMIHKVRNADDLPRFIRTVNDVGGQVLWGYQLLTKYDGVAERAQEIFSGTVDVSERSELRLGENFSMESGEVLVIDFKAAEGMELQYFILDAETGDLISSGMNHSGYRNYFMPLDSNLEGRSFFVEVSGYQCSGEVPFEVFTYYDEEIIAFAES